MWESMEPYTSSRCARKTPEITSVRRPVLWGWPSHVRVLRSRRLTLGLLQSSTKVLKTRPSPSMARLCSDANREATHNLSSRGSKMADVWILMTRDLSRRRQGCSRFRVRNSHEFVCSRIFCFVRCLCVCSCTDVGQWCVHMQSDE